MSTNQQKEDDTKQIRIHLNWHRKIKLISVHTGETMTEVLERLLGPYQDFESEPLKVDNTPEKKENLNF